MVGNLVRLPPRRLLELRPGLKQEAEDGYGVMRTVTSYSQTGEPIGSWHGKINIEYGTSGDESSNKVDLVFFDGDEPVNRIILSGPVIVVADNDAPAGEGKGTGGDTVTDAKDANPSEAVIRRCP